MITKYELLNRLKESGLFKGEDIHLTLDELFLLFPSIFQSEVLSTLLELDGVKLTASNSGGIVIPKEYFDDIRRLNE